MSNGVEEKKDGANGENKRTRPNLSQIYGTRKAKSMVASSK